MREQSDARGLRWENARLDTGTSAKGCSEQAAGESPCSPRAEVVAAIHRLKPAVVFAPQVETAAGLQLPEAYLTAVGNAVHEVGALRKLAYGDRS